MKMEHIPFVGGFAVVQFEGSSTTLSMIKWSILRRYRAARGTVTFFDTGARFIPKYEIAVYDGEPEVVYREPPASVLYYPNKATALIRSVDLKSAILEGGLFGEPVRDFIYGADLQRQHFWGVAGEFQGRGFRLP